ncbi:MAG TPA: TonB-dependent receptor [Gammaproteobacteria bacterium]
MKTFAARTTATHLAACLVLLPAPAIAAGQSAQLEPLVVTATRHAEDALAVPAAIDVIDSTELHRAKPGISLSESLQRVPGVFARDRENYAQGLQISVRGFGARASFGIRGVRLYTDGIPATMPDGQGQVSHFMLKSAKRIEVLRGPFSALYGNASGGVIAVFTEDAPAHPELSAGFVAGDFGLQRASLSFHSPLRNERENNGLLLDITHLETDGFREHSAAEETGGQALLKGAFGDGTRYTLLVNTFDQQALDPQGLTREQLQGERSRASAGALAFNTRKTVRQQQLGARIEQDVSAQHRFSVTAYTGNRATRQMLSIPVFVQDDPLQGGGAISLDRDYHGADARWQWSADVFDRPFSLAAGLAHEVSDELRRGYENFNGDQLGVFGALRRDEQNRVASRDLYLQAGWEAADRWRIHAGARYSEVTFRSDDSYITADNPDDSGDLDYSRVSPVAGVLFRVTPHVSVYANAGGGFETPTFSELAYRDDARSGLNSELKPSVSRNVEAGVRARHDTVKYSAAVFHSRTEDELIVTANLGGRSVYDNAGETRRRGIELAISGEISPRWHYAANYTLLDARYASDFAVCGLPPCAQDDVVIEAGRRIPGIARNAAWAELRFSPESGTYVMLEGRFVDRVFVNDANSESASAYATFDLAAERRMEAFGFEWRGFARINNLFDREYVGSVRVNDGNGRYYEPAPGRNWMIGLSAQFTFR